MFLHTRSHFIIFDFAMKSPRCRPADLQLPSKQTKKFPLSWQNKMYVCTCMYVPGSWWDVLTLYSLSMASRWVGCVLHWRKNGCDHCGNMWICPYLCMWVRMGSGSRSFAVRHHMFVQSEQGGYEYCWIWCRLIKVWMARWWRVWCCWQQCANFCV